MIKWALYLRHLSSKAYETMRKSGVIVLPSQRTLRDYTHFVQSRLGFSDEVDEQLVDAAKVTTLRSESLSSLMKYTLRKSWFSTSTRADWLISSTWERWMTYCCSLSDHLSRVKAPHHPSRRPCLSCMWEGYSMTLSSHTLSLPASHFLVITVQSVLGSCVSSGENGSQGHCSYRWWCLTQSKVLWLHIQTSDEAEYKTLNPFAVEKRFLYFFSDPSHLLKTKQQWQQLRSWQREKRPKRLLILLVSSSIASMWRSAILANTAGRFFRTCFIPMISVWRYDNNYVNHYWI